MRCGLPTLSVVSRLASLCKYQSRPLASPTGRLVRYARWVCAAECRSKEWTRREVQASGLHCCIRSWHLRLVPREKVASRHKKSESSGSSDGTC
eukprot:13846182-Alexandrium_andersonii.AAC.1